VTNRKIQILRHLVKSGKKHNFGHFIYLTQCFNPTHQTILKPSPGKIRAIFIFFGKFLAENTVFFVK